MTAIATQSISEKTRFCTSHARLSALTPIDRAVDLMITVTSSRQEWATKMWHASVPAAIGLLFASIQLQEFSLHSDKAPLAQSLWTAFTANALLVGACLTRLALIGQINVSVRSHPAMFIS